MDVLLGVLERAGGPYAAAEIALAAAFLLVAATRPRWGEAGFAWVERRFEGLSHSPVRQILAVGLLAILLRAAFLPWLGAPVASIHDEQSLMLQGQTLAAGRLVNPTHPFWEHFETLYVNHVPAYASMYFPGRGAPLALGIALADSAWLGVWLSFVVMAMAAVWMLQGWVSLPLALLGGVIVVLRFGVFSYWVNSYWGGAFSAFGAMLVVGALPRLLKAPRWRDGLAMGTGAAVLMTTRPVEGAVICLVVGGALIGHVLRGGLLARRHVLLRSALPVGLCVALGGALMLANNAATTGQALKTPYDLNRTSYAVAPAFLVSAPIKSEERGPEYFRRFFQTEAQAYTRAQTAGGLARNVAGKFFDTWNFYIGATFTVAFLAGLWSARREVFLLAALGLFMLAYQFETWNFPHYTSPLFPVLLVLVMRGFGWLRFFQFRGEPVGLFLTRAMPAAAVLLLAVPASLLIFQLPTLQHGSNTHACCSLSDRGFRNKLLERVRAVPGPHLIVVKDGPQNPLHFELVHNEPDIDNAPVVWARTLGAERDARLVAHFKDRTIWEFEWLAEPDPGYRFEPVREKDGKGPH